MPTTTILRPLFRFGRLSGRQRALLYRAVWLQALYSASVALLPFRRAIRFGCVPQAPTKSNSAEDIVWALRSTARRSPWRTMCIEQGLAGQRMLRAAGHDAILHYGVRPATGLRPLQAHVWITVGDEILLGGDDAADFAPVATYP